MVSLTLQNADQGACHGDSGGPLIIEDTDTFPSRHIQIGIVTGGAACGDESFPGTYARVDHPDIWNFIYYEIHGNRMICIEESHLPNHYDTLELQYHNNNGESRRRKKFTVADFRAQQMAVNSLEEFHKNFFSVVKDASKNQIMSSFRSGSCTGHYWVLLNE